MTRRLMGNSQTVLVSALVLFSMGLEVSAGAVASAKFSYAEREAETKRAMEIMANRVGSTRELTFFGVLAGIKPEAMQKIGGDIDAKSKGKSWPKLSMVKGEFFLDGEPSGVRVSSYAPLSLSFRGKKWTYERSMGAEENYTSLVSFLSERPNISWADYLIPVANAADTKATSHSLHNWPIFVGMVGGVTVVLVAGALTGVDEGIGLVALLGLAAGTGTGLAASNHMSTKDFKFLGNLMCSARLQFDQCDSNGVKLKISDDQGADKRELFIAGSGDKKGKFYLKDAKGNRVSSTALSNQQADLIQMVENGCNYGGSDFKPRWESAVKTACTSKRNEMYNDQRDPQENGPDGSASKAQ